MLQQVMVILSLLFKILMTIYWTTHLNSLCGLFCSFLAASGLMKSKATSSEPTVGDKKPEPSENSSPEKEGQSESGAAMDQLR